MRHASRTPLLEARVRVAWQGQMVAAVKTPGLLPELMRRRHELLPRFAAYYTQLRALPQRVRQALQRQWRLPLAGVALILALGQQPVQAATIRVGGRCTLVAAITAANTDTTARGRCPAGNGADTIVLPAGSTHTLARVDNRVWYGATGLPVIFSTITIEGQGSTITRASGAPNFRLFAVSSTGDLTLQETTVSGGKVPDISGGGVANFGGTLTLANSTITGNSAYYGGGVANFGTLTLAHTLVSGNTASTGPEISNGVGYGTVLVDSHNLFGVDGNAGVAGFSPGATDIVPSVGVLLPDILHPTLANNGGPTPTHALVPGSPAIDAIPRADPGCTGTDQRGVPRPQGAGCDVGAFEFGGGVPQSWLLSTSTPPGSRRVSVPHRPSTLPEWVP